MHPAMWLGFGLLIGGLSTWLLCHHFYSPMRSMQLWWDAHAESMESAYREQADVRKALNRAWEEVERCQTRELALRAICREHEIEVLDDDLEAAG